MAVDLQSGYGGGWGSTPWGDVSSSGLVLLSAVCARENVVRLVFNKPVSFTGLLNATDASKPSCYSISPVAGTSGMDGLATRSVLVVSASLVTTDTTGASVDVTVDRPFAAYPGQYTVTITGMTSFVGDAIDTTANAATFYGCTRAIVRPNPAQIIQSKDFANPQTLGQLQQATGDSDPTLLGTSPVDSRGDYAVDSGLENLKKRVFRRIMTLKGAFLHAPEYGLGLGARIKKLSTASSRAKLAAEAQAQLSQEPDVSKVKVAVSADGAAPNLVYFTVYIRTVAGLSAKFELPFDTS